MTRITLAEAIASVLGEEAAAAITMQQSERWAFAAAIAACPANVSPAVKAVLDAELLRLKSRARQDPVDYEQAGLDESGHPIPGPDEEWK